jgi:hypothetical protein
MHTLIIQVKTAAGSGREDRLWLLSTALYPYLEAPYKNIYAYFHAYFQPLCA